nr:hypothetical protein HmN_000089200 [Hymenolepis microstoma]
MSPKRLHSPLEHHRKISFYHRTYGNDAKKCQPGCNYSRIDSAISKLYPTCSKVSVFSRSAEDAFFNPFNTIKQQDLDMAESIEPNYQQSSTMVNPVKEFDTKIFQTDIQEPSKELPELADDTSSICVDIHNFPSDHSSSSTKKRERRKRKTPKSTATNQENLSKSVTQHHLLLWRLARRQRFLIHANPLLDSINLSTFSQASVPSAKRQAIKHKKQPSS